ncbi:MAG: DNA repair protein RecN, partial [Elusimicrobiota bacterium]
PQVACFAKTHFEVRKEVSGGRTRAVVERLSGEPRLQALARLLGGRAATEASRRHARELLESVG